MFARASGLVSSVANKYNEEEQPHNYHYDYSGRSDGTLSKITYYEGDSTYDMPLMEFDEHKTPDSRFAFFVDKIVAIKNMKRYYDEGKFHDLQWHIRNCEKVRENTMIQKMAANGAETAADVWFDEEWAPYKDDEFFMAVHRILYEMDTNIKPPELPD